ncbi:MAG: AAA family ATPase [Thermodesulfobacteriota bacterium]|nr:AAA family ATPase [Thermodesulfobacteriota bacterium]
MAEEKISVKLEIKDTKLKSQFENALRKIGGFNIQGPTSTARAELLIFELGDQTEKAFLYVQDLVNSGEVGEVFFVSNHSDQAVLRRAIRIGAREFFNVPIENEEIKHALEGYKGRREKVENGETIKDGKIINVIGSKGGVGTTTVAVNLAVSLAEKQSVQSVALIDMNLLFGDIPLFLDIDPKYNWSEITKNISRLDTMFLKNILSVDSSGVCVLPSPNYLSKQSMATPAIMERLLLLMRRMFDFVIVDGGQSLEDMSLKILELSDTVLLISILSLPCLSNTNKLLRTFHDIGFPRNEKIKIVINRYLKKSDISIKDAETSLAKDIFWAIPNDYQTAITATNRGKALSQFAPREEITRNFQNLAAELNPESEKQEKKGWSFFGRR